MTRAKAKDASTNPEASLSHSIAPRDNKTICTWGTHGSYNLQKILKFTSRLEKSLNSVKVLEKYLISLLGLQKSL